MKRLLFWGSAAALLYFVLCSLTYAADTDCKPIPVAMRFLIVNGFDEPRFLEDEAEIRRAVEWHNATPPLTNDRFDGVFLSRNKKAPVYLVGYMQGDQVCASDVHDQESFPRFINYVRYARA